MPQHTLLLYIIASAAKLSSEMVWAPPNKSVQYHGVSWGGLPKLNELELHGGIIGAE